MLPDFLKDSSEKSLRRRRHGENPGFCVRSEPG
jgi:hypothetical protein